MCSPDETRRRQHGTLLLELLVGLALGLLIVASAIGAMAIFQRSAATVNDMGQLQHQGAYAMRVLGLQLQQAGAVEFAEQQSPNQDHPGGAYRQLDGKRIPRIGGTEGKDADTLWVRTRVSGLTLERRDCLGNTLGEQDDSSLKSNFHVRRGQLYCQGRPRAAQPLVANVADFRVAYRVATEAGFQIFRAQAVETAGLWTAVRAVEVCLDLAGDTVDDVRATGQYTDCRNRPGISRQGRLHLVLRRVFDLGSRGPGA
jgi:type IV pilus assembly protein PilW